MGIGGFSRNRHENSSAAALVVEEPCLVGEVSLTTRKLGMTARSTTTPARTNGTLSPQYVAARPPTSGPANIPTRWIPSIVVI